MPDIQRLHETYSDLVILGVSVDDDASTARSFAQKNWYTYTMAMDDDNYTVSWRIFPTNYIPNSIFIDPNGVVTYIDFSAMSYDRMESLYLEAKANATPPEPAPTLGDVNGDGTVDSRDLLQLAKFIAGSNVTIDAAAADMNGDGNVDGRDVLRLAKQLAGV